jgi:hypothetical protein
VPKTVAGQPAIEGALGLTAPGVEVGIEQGIGLRVGPGRRGQEALLYDAPQKTAMRAL